MKHKNALVSRMILIYGILGLTFPLVAGKILYTQFWEGERLKQRVRTEQVEDKEIAPTRGDILAEDGRVLSLSLPTYTLYFDPLASKEAFFEAKIDSLSMLLSRTFRDGTPSEYRAKIRAARYGAKPNRYLRLGSRDASFTEFQQIKTFPLLRAPKDTSERKSPSGLISTRHDVRRRPYDPLARQTIGYLGITKEDPQYRGRAGLEEAYELDLRGVPGISRARMFSGTWIPIEVKKPERGRDVVTTINVDYQYIVHEALLRQLRHYQARSGMAILMEVKTGDVKAMANLTRRGTSSEYVEELNGAIRNIYEPGSVFKTAVMMALLEDGHVHPDDTVDLGNGIYTYHDGRRLHDQSHGHVGKVTVQYIFEQSLNGISTLAYRYYDKQRTAFADRLYAMHLNKKLGVEIAGETTPVIRYPTDKRWSGNTVPWMAIGYEVMLTPLQILSFYNTLANDGRRMKPRFVKEIRAGDKVVRRVPPEVVDRSICSQTTLNHLRNMLEGVAERGTASSVRGTTYGVAGKTGTARLAAAEGRGYGEVRYLSSFVGYFPARDPLYSCIVMIEDPLRSKGYYGNAVSGTAFREISDRVYALASPQYIDSRAETNNQLPVSKNGYKSDLLALYDALDIRVQGSKEAPEWVAPSRAEGEIILKPREVDFTMVPNVKGMGLRDALYLLENSGLRVGVSGAGMVMKQTIEPGRKVARGSYIHVELK